MTEERALVESEGISGAAIMERVVITGDLSKLTPVERVAYYARTCESLGLNPLTRPFDYISLNGRLTLYATKGATDQIRRNLGVAITSLEYPAMPDGLFGVVAKARDRLGREDSASGIVNIRGLAGEALANAMMKAETKAKRRVTLSLSGLGMIDESEVSSIPDGQLVEVDEAGNIKEPPRGLSDVIAARVEAITQVEVPGEYPTAGVIEGSGDATPDYDEPSEPASEPTPLDTGPQAEERAQADVPREAERVVTPAASGLSLEAFATRVQGIDRDLVRSVARELFPFATGFRQLSDEQRGVLAHEITRRAAAEVEEYQDAAAAAHVVERVAEGEEILAAPMAEEESADLPAECGEESPFSGLVCQLVPDHKGAHRHGDHEAW